MPARLERIQHGRAIVADGAQHPHANDGRLPRDPLPVQRLAHHLHAFLPGRGLQLGNAGLGAIKSFPHLQKLLQKLVGRHPLWTKHHMCAIVVAPVAVNNALLTLHPVPVQPAGVGGEQEKFRGVNLRLRRQLQNAVGDGGIVPVAAHRERPKKADAMVLQLANQVLQHAPLRSPARDRRLGDRVHIHRAVEIGHARLGHQPNQLRIAIQRQRGGNEVALAQALQRLQQFVGVRPNAAVLQKERVVRQVHILKAQVADLLHHLLDRTESNMTPHVRRQYAHDTGKRTSAGQLDQILVPVVMTAAVKNVPARRTHLRQVKTASALVDPL